MVVGAIEGADRIMGSDRIMVVGFEGGDVGVAIVLTIDLGARTSLCHGELDVLPSPKVMERLSVGLME